MAESKVVLHLGGRRVKSPDLPDLLKPGLRTGPGRRDDFLPPQYLKAKWVVELSPATRDTSPASPPERMELTSGQILVLELVDGGMVITSAERLRSSLVQTRPELVDGDVILLDEIRISASGSPEATATPGTRGLGGTAARLIYRVYCLVAQGQDDLITSAMEHFGLKAAEIAVTWAGTQALMWAIESRLLSRSGALVEWRGSTVAMGEARRQGRDASLSSLEEKAQERLQTAAVATASLPILVLIHGTASNTEGSFGDLQRDEQVLRALESTYRGGIFAFEHRTLSESPIDNALQLARALPARSRLSLVSHSRGGLVADLLCLADFGHLIAEFGRRELPGTGDTDQKEAESVREALDAVYETQRAALLELSSLLRDKAFVIERYVRVASPAHGTRLASGNFDVFMSGLLNLIGWIPQLRSNPIYGAFKRVVVEIAKNRTNPHMVPGIEAMLPDSPLARLLAMAPVRPGIEMAIIAGDVDGGPLLRRLAELLCDFLLFDQVDNDLVVDTAAMVGGIAQAAKACTMFDRGPQVSHFRYFENVDTRHAIRDWLVNPKPHSLSAFQAMADRCEDRETVEQETQRLRGIGIRRGREAAALPVVVILPGIMGSHLWSERRDRVWFDPLDLVRGGIRRIAWDCPDVTAEKLFTRFYGELANHLAQTHRVERFAYDWRQPLDILGDRLGQFLDGLLAETAQPVRLLAHSLGGLVVRACIFRRREVMDALMRRDGARFIMLGTPNQGSHSMVENLVGKGPALRNLVRLDLKHSMQEVLDIVADFRGALQLLPKPGFVDTFHGEPGGGVGEIKTDGQSIALDYWRTRTWALLKPRVHDLWFGDGNCPTPSQSVLDAAGWLWAQDPAGTPSLPESYAPATSYVFGIAANTACGICFVGDDQRLKMVGTTRGDGTVTWDSGRIGHVGSYYYLPAEHGSLLASREHFPALTELLTTGRTSNLAKSPPATRKADGWQGPLRYEPGPPVLPDQDKAAWALFGSTPRAGLVVQQKRRLEVGVTAMDLRFVSHPILVGHYQGDPIAGPELLVDCDLLDGDLSERYSLGLYPGPLGTATAVLRVPNSIEGERGSLTGAVVTGLGTYERQLSADEIAAAVRAGVLRYLLHSIDVLGRKEGDLRLVTLLLGYNSSANLSVGTAVEVLVRGVLEGNARFYETTHLPLRVAQLEIIEVYLDTAVTAAYALRALEPRLADLAARLGSSLVCHGELQQGEGCRPRRLAEGGDASYWPRLIITDGQSRDAEPTRAAAGNLRFLYIGQRARAESILHQRQPDLVESLVTKQINCRTWTPDLGRLLFQLMIPHELKETIRQMTRVVLVVDRATANLPWELMLADTALAERQRPLATRTPVIRQLESIRFRQLVRQGADRAALVIGNPSVAGFAAHFGTSQDPDSLPGAEREAAAVAGILEARGYTVQSIIGAVEDANAVLTALNRRSYRFVHISAHGVFELPRVDGQLRTGVVLSDGLLITAAEIGSMEVVPELVFLNCCHLGVIDATVRQGNRLASSMARELIEIGVRCVVVAGWAIDDEGARIFGQAFYDSLLVRHLAFGEAVFEARQAVVSQRGLDDISWGAFQAYGDAGWFAESRVGARTSTRSEKFATPEELLDALASLRADIRRKRGQHTEDDIEVDSARIEELLGARSNPAWRCLPATQSALGATWAALGRHDEARQAYVRAIQGEDRMGRVPIGDIEQLANMEARLGHDRSDPDLLRRALERLEHLDKVTSADQSQLVAHGERHALRGSAWKRLAAVHAAQMNATEDSGRTKPVRRAGRVDRRAGARANGTSDRTADQSPEQALGEALKRAVNEAIRAYQGDPASADGQDRDAYRTLNWLALKAVTFSADDSSQGARRKREAEMTLAYQCGRDASGRFSRQGGFFNASMQAEAQLVRALLSGEPGQSEEAGNKALDEVSSAYQAALRGVAASRNEIDSVVKQLTLLADIRQAWTRTRTRGEEASTEGADRTVKWLRRLGERLIDGTEQRPPRGG